MVILNIVISLMIFTIIILSINYIIDLITGKEKKVNGRLKQILNLSADYERNKYLEQRLRKAKSQSNNSSWLQGLLQGKFLQQEKILLEQSGVPLKVEEYLAICLLSGTFMLVIVILLINNGTLAFLAAFLGILVPGLWVRSIKKKRYHRMEIQLLNSVTLLSNSLRAGYSFMQALELVSRETPSPLHDEFNRIIRETNMGVRIEDALGSFSARTDSREIELMVTGILIQREVGGNLAEILDVIADTIDKRIKMRAKIKTLTAQGRLSGWIVSLLPVALVIFIYLPHPEYAQVMLAEPMGRVMLAMGLGMIIAGTIIIKKVVNIDA